MNVSTLLAGFSDYPIDRTSMPQGKLDLANRQRTSLFPWRGQFSPELIEMMLAEFAVQDAVVIDPFVGSGTTLFEAARKSLECYGAEINPAAVIMSSTVRFVNLYASQRTQYCDAAKAIVEKYVGAFEGPLFSFLTKQFPYTEESHEVLFGKMMADSSSDPLLLSIIANAAMRFLSLEKKQSQTGVLWSVEQQLAVIRQLPFSAKQCKVFHCDARCIPLSDGIASLIVTSPPYINVFNYHQNDRSVMELLGWNLLQVAKSEIGSNRKHRGNRFLTVIQYAIDMFQALLEMRRLVQCDGRIIVVVGRRSSVRGISFPNGRMLACLGTGGAGLRLASRQERKFKNKFGEIIYEDILHFVRDDAARVLDEGFARELGCRVLEESLNGSAGDVRADVEAALRQFDGVESSPIFNARPMAVVTGGI